MKSHLSITSRMQIDPTEWAGNSQGLFSKYLTDKESRECRWTHRKEELVQLCPTFTHLVWDRIKLCCGVMGTEGKELLCNWDCVALVTLGRSRNFSVLSLPCSLLAFSSGTPPATSLDEIPRSKELMPKEPWADWADLCLLKIQRNDYNNIRKTNKKKEQVILSLFCSGLQVLFRLSKSNAAPWLPGAMEYLMVENTREGVVYEKLSQSLVQTWSYLSRWWMWSTCCSELGKTPFNGISKIHAQCQPSVSGFTLIMFLTSVSEGTSALCRLCLFRCGFTGFSLISLSKV